MNWRGFTNGNIICVREPLSFPSKSSQGGLATALVSSAGFSSISVIRSHAGDYSNMRGEIGFSFWLAPEPARPQPGRRPTGQEMFGSASAGVCGGVGAAVGWPPGEQLRAAPDVSQVNRGDFNHHADLSVTSL